MANLYQYQSQNIHRTWLMFAVFFVVVAGIGWVFSQAYGDPSFIIFAVLFSVIYSFISYYSSAAIALKMAKAQEIQKSDNPMFWNIVENLTIAAGLPMPKLYITPEMQINAFATGRDPQHAAVAVTEGALQRLNKTELKAFWRTSFHTWATATFWFRPSPRFSRASSRSSLTSFYARFSLAAWAAAIADAAATAKRGEIFFIAAIVLSILAPIGTMLIQLAISRRREALADASGVLLTRYPEGLICALQKIERRRRPYGVGEGFHRAYVARYAVQGQAGFVVAQIVHDPSADRGKDCGVEGAICLIALFSVIPGLTRDPGFEFQIANVKCQTKPK